EYSTTAPGSASTEIAPFDVMLSDAEDPVSAVRTTEGAEGFVVSRVKSNEVVSDALPAPSTWRTRTVLAPSWALKDEVQVPPPLVEYSTVAPPSVPPTLRAPFDVT